MAAVIRVPRSIPTPNGFAVEAEAVAIDRAPWWEVIDREQWDHRQVMYLLQRLEDALFSPTTAAPDENEDVDFPDWANGAGE